MELLIIMVVGGLFEMLSVSLMLPFMTIAMAPDEYMTIPIVVTVCKFFSIQSSKGFLVFLAVLMAGVYIIKNIYLLVQMYVQNLFVYNNLFRTQTKLLKSYLNRPYEFFLSAKSGEILRIVQNDTSETFSLLTNVLTLISELIVSSFLIVTIFIMSPMITLAIAVLMLIVLSLIIVIIRPVLRKLGLAHLSSSTKMNQWLLQSINGIKELKILRKADFFVDNYKEAGKAYISASTKNVTLSNVPRFMIEAGSMATVFIVIACFIYSGWDLKAILPMLSSIAVAAIRILPSINRISVSTANMAFSEAKLDKVIENLNDTGERNYKFADQQENYLHSKGNYDFRDKIELQDVKYRYPTGEKNVLNGVSISILKGQSIGIIGPSGSGKSTLVDILIGLLKPSDGKVLVDGADIGWNIDDWLAQIGYIPQNVFMLDASIKENVAFGVNIDQINEEKVWQSLKKAAMDDFVMSLPKKLDTNLGENGARLSGGQRQRIAIARALYFEPSVLFFDEATSALDSVTEATIMESIYQLHGEKTMIIIAHRISSLDGCDVLFEVKDGNVIVHDRRIIN